MSLRIQPKIVPESSYTRQLELADRLSEFLAKVSEFKAMRKFDALFFKPKPEGSGKHYNGHHEDLRLTEFSYFISEGYGRTEFQFYRCKANQSFSERTSLTFDIAGKSIPAITEALAAHKAKLGEWTASENEVDVYAGGVCREIERMFDREMTSTQFRNTKTALAETLRGLAKLVEAARE